MEFFMRQPDIENVLSVVGSSPRIGTSQANAQFTVMLKPWDEKGQGHREDYADRERHALPVS